MTKLSKVATIAKIPNLKARVMLVIFQNTYNFGTIYKNCLSYVTISISC